MDTGLYEAIRTQWGTIAGALDEAGPLANGLQIIGFLGSCFVGLRLFVHRRLKSAQGRISLQESQISHLRKVNDELSSSLEETSSHIVALESQLPRTALSRAAAERELGNHERADRVLREWVDSEGEALSALLLERANWVASCAVGGFEDIGVTAHVVAKAYATAATVFRPSNESGVALIDEIDACIGDEARWVPALKHALESFDERSGRLADLDAASEVRAADAEAQRLFQRGYYHLALPLCERSIVLRLRAAGPNDPQTAFAQRAKCYILEHLGRQDEALPIAILAADVMQASPGLGAAHPSTLATRFLVAKLLHDLGRDDEALPIARAAADGLQADPTLEAGHPDPPVSSNLVAQILSALGRSGEALPIARASAKGMEDSHALGSAHPYTLMARSLIAELLDSLGQPDEALQIESAVAEAMVANPALGPTHPTTLVCRSRVAVLLGRKHPDRALPIAREVAEAMEASAAIGPKHPDTQQSRCQVASILGALGRVEEALPIARAAAEAMEAIPALGPEHPRTLGVRFHVAWLLSAAGRSEEALQLARVVAEAMESSPARGPVHPDTVKSRELVAHVLRQLE